jgi:hypothetical protein
MPARLQREEEYLGFGIRVRSHVDVQGCGATVSVTSPDGRIACWFIERLDPFVQSVLPDWPNDDEEGLRKLADRAFHRARGAILLDRLHELNDAHLWVPQETRYAERSDEYIRRLVLMALDQVIRLEPGLGMVSFDDTGLSLIENIDPKRLEYVITRLERAGEVEYFSMGDRPGNRRFRATPRGLGGADKLRDESKAPGFLLEETVARVETALNKHKPELAESLRRQSVRVAEAGQLSEHEVGEIAQACEQIIWDFLDLDALWQGVPEERPPKDKTRDRVRVLLRARAPSDTETSLLEALEQYLVGWFGPLEVFVHKHRHLPGESERRHAKRLVTYTYLLLADLSEVLGL